MALVADWSESTALIQQASRCGSRWRRAASLLPPLAAGRDFVWTATLEGNVLRIDPALNAVTGRASVAPEARAIATAEDAVWVSSQVGILTQVRAN